MLSTMLHRGNRAWCEVPKGRSRLPKELAPAPDLRFNLKKMPYMLVAAFKSNNRG
jgi:hypothetical protein